MAEPVANDEAREPADPAPPPEHLGRLFLRFLRFGALAWGGPVAQIGMIRDELVDAERWISSARFNRVLAVYQALPGPEAHELCVYFGTRARGRIGGLLAGIGFMLPGFVLMFALSVAYQHFELRASALAAAFAGCQPAVVALIVRAAHRIGSHALHDRWLLALGAASALATLLGVSFALVLPASGLAYAVIRGRSDSRAQGVALIPLAASAGGAGVASALGPSVGALFVTGLRSGLLTFGGAYTVIPFLRADAVGAGGWMSDVQFLDGLALSGILPAPLVIFSTFVGYLGGGALGALAVTAGVFLPAFAFTLIGHQWVERVVEERRTHALLDGVTAGVVGLIAVTALELARATLLPGDRPAWPALAIFAAALFAAFRWKARTAVAWIVAGAALAGFALLR
jgi:chromate transporter